jgi:hypothetical protein
VPEQLKIDQKTIFTVQGLIAMLPKRSLGKFSCYYKNTTNLMKKQYKTFIYNLFNIGLINE